MLDRDASVNECPPAAAPHRGMAPSPENDPHSAPKAPDKPRHDRCPGAKEKHKDDKTLSDLNDGELKGLLDEALNYKNPKDREGKSKLFNHLLNEAEEDERNARAARAGGSELVRYCNPSAKRNSRHRKKPSSISENMMHGGSLDNLAKEELFETSKHRTKKSVSARQREGGSLPCNVNASTLISHDYQFLEEARKKKEMAEKISTDVVEEQRLLEHDTLDQNFQEKVNEIPQLKFTTRASLQVNEVDGPIQFPHLDQGGERKNCATAKSATPIIGPDSSGTFRISNEAKKVDENGNALHQNSIKTKKKKVQTDKNVVVCKAENVEGHRSDIISDIDKLMEFIGISDGPPIKSKQLNRHSSDDTSKSSKKRSSHPSSKAKDGTTDHHRAELQKSNSLGEISTSKLDGFAFDDDDDEDPKVTLRNSKNSTDKRRSLGTVDSLPHPILYSNASVENLETAEFRVVTKKKKSKKRRNSVSGRATKATPPEGKAPGARGPSPDARRKSTCSVPHSEKSNDSSDADSVHSLPADAKSYDLAAARLNMPISYADMAKTNDKPKEKRPIESRVPKEAAPSDSGSNNRCAANLSACDHQQQQHVAPTNSTETSPISVKNSCTPPDVHNIRNFPAISKQVVVQQQQQQVAATVAVTPVTKTSSSSNKINRNVNANRNVKNNANRTTGCANEMVIHAQNEHVIPALHDLPDMGYSSSLPPDIPDVQTIEKMQLMCQGHPTSAVASSTSMTPAATATTAPAAATPAPAPIPVTLNFYDRAIPVVVNNYNNAANDFSVDCDNNQSDNHHHHNNNRTSGAVAVDERPPPVVVLSGHASRDVSGLEFGFDVNEQLLNEDNESSICDDFMSRYVPPENYTATSHNHEKIVNYIGGGWIDAVDAGAVEYHESL